MKPPETMTVETQTVSCDGLPTPERSPGFAQAGGDDLGHPRVYLTMKNGEVDCPYCGRHYVLAAGAKKVMAH